MNYMYSINNIGQLVKNSSWNAAGDINNSQIPGSPPYEETPGSHANPPIVQTIDNKGSQFIAYKYHQLIIGILIVAAAVLIIKD
jgi:hypothetical protein